MPSGSPESGQLRLAFCLSCLFLTACATHTPAEPDTFCAVEPRQEQVMCTMEYAPVCGCDGVTYSNACQAGAAGVPTTVPGSCSGEELR